MTPESRCDVVEQKSSSGGVPFLDLPFRVCVRLLSSVMTCARGDHLTRDLQHMTVDTLQCSAQENVPQPYCQSVVNSNKRGQAAGVIVSLAKAAEYLHVCFKCSSFSSSDRGTTRCCILVVLFCPCECRSHWCCSRHVRLKPIAVATFWQASAYVPLPLVTW